jgi:sec-independent protein translocase protein TatA
MFGFGLPEMCIVLVIVLLVAGPSKLPQFGQALGSSIRGFKKAVSEDETAKIDEKK